MARKRDKRTADRADPGDDTVDAEVVELGVDGATELGVDHATELGVAGVVESSKDALEVRPANVPAREISSEARLIRGAFRVAGLAVGTVVRSGQWAAETTLEVGKQIAQVAVEGESPAELAEFASDRLRSIARSTLGVGEESVREVVSYVPSVTPSRPEHAAATPDELRRRGDELLAMSADVYFSDDVHPAYSRILDELAPDEARILRFLAVHGPQPIVDVRTNRPLGIGSELVANDLTSVPVQAGVRHILRARSYLINLKRLGLVQVLSDPVLLSRYMVLEVQPVVDEALKRAGRAPKIVRKSLCLTEFGEDFGDTCFTIDRRSGESR